MGGSVTRHTYHPVGGPGVALYEVDGGLYGFVARTGPRFDGARWQLRLVGEEWAPETFATRAAADAIEPAHRALVESETP